MVFLLYLFFNLFRGEFEDSSVEWTGLDKLGLALNGWSISSTSPRLDNQIVLLTEIVASLTFCLSVGKTEYDWVSNTGRFFFISVNVKYPNNSIV